MCVEASFAKIVSGISFVSSGDSYALYFNQSSGGSGSKNEAEFVFVGLGII